MRCRIGETVYSDSIQATTNNPKSAIIWPCTSANDVGCLYAVDGTLNSKNHIANILQPKVFSGNFFQIIPHIFSSGIQLRARIWKQWSTDTYMHVLWWSGNRPDLNLIEYMWFRLKKQLPHLSRPFNKVS